MSQLRTSIIINTCNRASYLQRLLAGLGHLRNSLFEVVVVNGPSRDGSLELLAEYRGYLKVLSCPTRNLSQSRNLGLAAAAGEVVAFIDDDALPGDIDWLARFETAFASDSHNTLGAVGGPVLRHDTSQFEFKGGQTSDYGFQVFGSELHKPGEPNQHWIAGVRGCNCAFRRQALAAIGGFDEAFTYYLDETDVCWRLARAGFTIQYLPDNSARHYAAPAEHRASPVDRDWRTITRSDTYFALKNGSDPLFQRLLRMIAGAPRKHFAIEIRDFWRNGQISFWHWLWLVSQWAAGVVGGSWVGLFRRRRLRDFSSPPPPFLPFETRQTERRLRVALLTQTIPGQPNNGGIGRYTLDLARGLHERGHEVHVICKDERPLHYESLEFLIHGISATACAPQGLNWPTPVLNKNLSYALAVVHRLAELYAQGIEFDVVHASNWDVEAAALIRAQVYPVSLMLVSPLAQVMLTEGWPLTEDLQACTALDRWQIEHADAVCVPTEGAWRSYQTLMQMDPQSVARLHLTPLGIAPRIAVPLRTRPNGRHRLLFVGRLERRKGAHVLLDVLPALLKAFPNWECHFVGNDQIVLSDGGTLKMQFQSRHRGATWLQRVFFHGVVQDEELWQLYRACDLFVAPSVFESFGLIYHEAMQFGKPVVGCSAGGIPEVVADGVEGVLVTPDQPDELRTALAGLMGDSGLRLRLGAAGRRRIHQGASYQAMAKRLEEVFLELTETAGAERKARRERQWPKILPLFDSSPLVIFDGPWTTNEVAPGHPYRLGEVGAKLWFTANAAARLQLTLLRHSWSGVLEICAGQTHQLIDLYKSGELQLEHIIDIQLAGDRTQHVEVVLRVHPERNPASYASQVWLKQILITSP